MGPRVTIDDAAATFPAATSCSESGRILPPEFAVLARRLWGPKAPVAVEEYTGRPDRTCRAWCSDTDITGTGLIAVLRGKEGYRVLVKIMEPAPPDWWRNLQLERELAAIANDIFERIGVLRQ